MCVTRHASGWPRFFPLLREGWGVGFFLFPFLFPWNFHCVFIKFASFQYVPQVSNVFPNLFPVALTLCHILCPQYYSCNLYKGAQRMRLQHIISVSGMFKICAQLNKDVDQCVCFFWRNIAKFRPEKYDFDVYKGFSTRKWPKFARLSIKKVPDHQIFMISSTRQPRIQEEPVLVCNQIWLNHLSYITKLKKKNLDADGKRKRIELCGPNKLISTSHIIYYHQCIM